MREMSSVKGMKVGLSHLVQYAAPRKDGRSFRTEQQLRFSWGE